MVVEKGIWNVLWTTQRREAKKDCGFRPCGSCGMTTKQAWPETNRNRDSLGVREKSLGLSGQTDPWMTSQVCFPLLLPHQRSHQRRVSRASLVCSLAQAKEKAA